jgi:hypothetical protein
MQYSYLISMFYTPVTNGGNLLSEKLEWEQEKYKIYIIKSFSG